MSAAVESLVEQFESRKLSRRDLVASLAVSDVEKAASGGDQLYIVGFDNHRIQVGPHGYQG